MQDETFVPVEYVLEIYYPAAMTRWLIGFRRRRR